MVSFALLSTRFARIPAPVRGALWMVTASTFFAAMVVVARHLSGELHPVEIVFFRTLFGVLFMAPWLVHAGGAGLRTRRFGLHLFRAMAVMSGMICLFTAVTLMPLAEATALTFTQPLFAAAGAALFLGERVGVRRVAAIVVGFAGAVLILRPGAATLVFPAFLVLLNAALIAVSVLSLKSLSRTDPPNVIVLYLSLLMLPLTLPPTLLVWTTPSIEALGWAAAIGGFATLAQLAYVRALAAADVTAVLPFGFTQLVVAALFGYLLYGERLDPWTGVGAAIILAAAVYTAEREARARRPRTAAAPPPPAPGGRRSGSAGR